MRGLGSVVFLLWIYLHLGSCSYAEILWGQCYAFCLTRQESRQKEENVDTPHTFSATAVNTCFKNKECKWCLFPCERPREEYDDNQDCLNDCKNSRARHNEAALKACNEGCGFISQSTQYKFGTCPAASDMHGFSTACVTECSRDIDCDGMKKCCDNGCGKICHRPLEYDELPSVPYSLTFKERNDGGLLVEWESSTQDTSQPVIYVFRWWCPSVHKVRSLIATTARVKLHGYPSGVPPAAKCQFMVSAVSVNGSQGFCKVQTYTKKFLSPSPPVNLEAKKYKVHDGKVDVTVQWQPPLYTDGLKVTRYLVFWSDNLPKASPNYMRLYMKKKALNAERTSYTIPKLELSANYFIQVRAEVKWKEKTIRGKPVSTYIETHSVPEPAGPEIASTETDDSKEESPIYNVTIHKQFAVNFQLRVNVTWSVHLGYHVEKYMLFWAPDVCNKEASHRKTRDRLKQEATTHKREFQLYNLQFGCVYELRIFTVRLGVMGEGRREYFRTLPCLESQEQGLDVSCSPQASPPPSPSDMSVHYKSIRGCMCQAVIRWQRQSDQSHKVNQYSVLWGQSQPPRGGELASAIVYYAEPYKIQVSGTENEVCVTYLENNKHYTAQIIAFASKLRSKPAVLHFVTPTNMHPCYGTRVKTEADLDSGFLGSVQKSTEELQTTTPMSGSALPQTVLTFVFLLCCLSYLVCS